MQCVLADVPGHPYNLSARRLLFKHIGPRQSAFFIRYACIWVRGKRGLYCLSPNDSAFGIIRADFNGKPQIYICCHPTADAIPVVDKVLLDYLHLTSDEDHFLYRTIMRNYSPPSHRKHLGGRYQHKYAFDASNYWTPPPVPYWI